MPTKTESSEIAELRAEIARLQNSMSSHGTTAQVQSYPDIIDAEPSSGGEWVTDTRGSTAPDQEYVTSGPAPIVIERQPITAGAAAYVDPGSNKFANQLVAALISAGLMEPA